MCEQGNALNLFTRGHARFNYLDTYFNNQATMSSSEEGFIDVSDSGSESDDFEPTGKKVGHLLSHAATKAKTVQKLVNSKAPITKAKPKSSSKKGVLVDHDENAEDNLDDNGEEDASDRDQFGASSNNLQVAAPAKKKKTASETYTKVVDFLAVPV